MGLIESEEAAKRLARVIVSDIEIYNREKFQAGADLTHAIEEGRALFRSRVVPELLPLFTSVLEDRRASGKRPAEAKPAAPAAPAPAAKAPAPAAEASEPAAARAPAAAVRVAAPGMTASTTPAETTDEPPASAERAPEPATAVPVAAAPALAPAPPVASPPEPTAASAVAAPAAAARPASAPAGRGGIIDSEEAAARLARVILSDVELYNAKKIAAGADLTYEIDEGRNLFRARVKPELLPIFESTLATKGLGKRKRTASPAPVARAKPAAAVPAEPAPPIAAAPVAAAPTPAPVPAPRSAPPAGVARPSISAAKAPPATQPRPGLAVPPRRPTPAPIAVPAPIADIASGRHHAAPTARPGLGFEPPTQDEKTPTPGALAGMAIEATPPPSEPVYAAPRHSASRPAATPPAVPAAARHTGPQMRVATPVPHSPPPRRERALSSPDLPIHVDSGPLHGAHAGSDPNVVLPPQAVLDALPAPEPLPPVPTGFGQPVQPMELHGPTPGSLGHHPAPARLPTPASLPVSLPPPPAPPEIFAEAPSTEEIVSLRKGMSKARLLLTLTALGGAGGALWYFFLR